MIAIVIMAMKMRMSIVFSVWELELVGLVALTLWYK